MAKLGELKIPELKKELERRGLATTGNKAELQPRLREAMWKEDINVDEYAFHHEVEEAAAKIEEKEEAPCTATGVDMNMMLAAMSQMLSQNSS